MNQPQVCSLVHVFLDEDEPEPEPEPEEASPCLRRRYSTTSSWSDFLAPGAGVGFGRAASKASLRAAAEKQQREQDEMAASFAQGHGHGRMGSASSRYQQQYVPGEGHEEESAMMQVGGGGSRTVGPEELRTLAMEKRRSLLDPRSIMYGFGVHWGRDGREHLGVDRVQRGESRMMHFD